jgi:CheY-like chemotaxis protein
MRPPSSVGALAETRVLVVDDDEDWLDLMAALLASRGAQVLCAQSVENALEMLDEMDADVVLSDLEMPGPDGFELIRSLRGSSIARVARMPAIALTARADMSARERALAAGFSRHLVKPVDAVVLCAEIAMLSRMRTSMN